MIFYKRNKAIACFLLCGFLCGFLPSLAQAQSRDFQVEDIKVTGLKRVSSDVVFAAMNITAGQLVNQSDLQQLIRDLFATEYFADVQVGVDDNVLVIQLKERPVIREILIEGNKAIPTDALIDGLKNIDLAVDEVFKQSALESISKQLSVQYGALGRYATRVDTYVRELQQNKVLLGIKIQEGRLAKIKHINIFGNEVFAEEELLDLFRIKTTGGWSWLSGSDKFARQRLNGDLERLRSFYLNRGYLKFNIRSSQVSLSPDKESAYITVSLEEGEAYRVSTVELAGDPVLPVEEVLTLVSVAEGETFSQLEVTETEEAIIQRLSNEGYSQVRVNTATDINDETLQAKITFNIDPGVINYVRRIVFTGNTGTADQVLRREMRQLEGAPVSTEKLRQSRRRLERLGLFGQVDLQTQKVPGSVDQVDVIITVTEQPTASVSASIGFSSSVGLSLGAGIQHNNWLGTGNTFGFNVETSKTQDRYSLNFSNPYFTRSGVSRGISLFYRQRDFSSVSISSFATNSYGANVTFGYPISETGRISLGLGAENTEVKTGATTVQEIKGSPDFRSSVGRRQSISQSEYEDILTALGGINAADTNRNGFLDEKDTISSNVVKTDSAFDVTPSDIGEVNLNTPEGFIDKFGNKFNTYSLNLGWSNNTFNRGVFPTSGWRQRFNADVAVPVGDLEFYRLSYRSDVYFPIVDSWSLRLRGRIAYAGTYGKTDRLPFFENFFSGGVGSVRGFRPSSLGPKGSPAQSLIAAPVDLNGDNNLSFVYVLDDNKKLVSQSVSSTSTIGGDTLLNLSTELIFPAPFSKSRDKVRTSWFVDAGNVFSTECAATQRNCSDIDLGRLSISTGLTVQWLSPIAPLVFSFSRPLVKQELDKTEFFQFSLSQSF